MKNRLLIAGILAFALVLGITVTGCDTDGVTGGKDNSTTGGNDNGTTGGNDNGTTGGKDNGTTGDNGNNGENDIDEDLPLPLSSGVNAVSGKTYFKNSYRKIVFSVTADGAINGTYVGYHVESGEYKPNDKYSYIEMETGIYSWNEEEKTVTLKPEGAAQTEGGTIGSGGGGGNERIDADFGDILDKVTFRKTTQAIVNSWEEEEEGIDQWISERFGFSSITDYVNYWVNETFSNKTYAYSFSADEEALFFERALPANKGENELSGQTYHTSYGPNGENKNRIYVFTTNGYTQSTTTGYTQPTTTGSYAYDSDKKLVWLRVEKVDGKDRAAYYAVQTVPSDYRHKLVDDNAYRAAVTNGRFGELDRTPYNSVNKTITQDR